jgi:hypothetical protein
MTFYGVSSSVDDLDNNTLLDLGLDFASDFAAFSYVSDGDTATLNASIASADVGGGLGDLPIDPTDITGDIFSANLIVSMPGTVVEHNADEVRGDGSLLWNIPLTGSVDVTAVSDLGSGSSSWILWVLIGVLAVGIIAAVTATILSRKDSKKAVDDAAAAHVAASSQAPPPAPTGEPIEDVPSPDTDTSSADAGDKPGDDPTDADDGGDDSGDVSTDDTADADDDEKPNGES